ncbi:MULTISPECIES: TetR/AcrR family transcriptional regulator [unclassified Xanthobacter]|uniref:TetR/AcrR family transcriptional regulator n=1 Tax=unclassified Xanthobacter TaxID=2623496 RepID=UPI001EDFBFE1|nr:MULTISPECIES: TetR/AcrR family transcriptional regulator [unclassified Xanthobacter]
MARKTKSMAATAADSDVSCPPVQVRAASPGFSHAPVVEGTEPKARDRIIDAATRLFCQYGITAVGVDAVVAEAATAKATLYKTFGSKERLVEAVLEREGAAWRDWFIGELLKGEATPMARLRRIFPVLRQWFTDDAFFGCPFINAVAETDKRDDRMRQIALNHKKVVLDTLTTLADEAGARDAHGLAHQLGLLIDGAIVAAMITKDANVALLAGQSADLLLRDRCAAAA